ncbi:hypothetical protein AMJ57_00850 [Parcubacteria bacterium SG8_24]|nr:MAG: hypothetical protein AMJ57_00850 [Parcubacteria bacterium SG8_24]
MGAGKKLVKGLAAGAVLYAVGSYIMKDKRAQRKKAALQKVADRTMNRVVKHAKSLGKLSKASFDKIVDATVAEYRGMKDLSSAELKEMKAELKGSWKDVREVMQKPKKAPGRAKRK